MSGMQIERSDEEVDYLIKYIFGDTDDEDEDFEGFTDEDMNLNTEIVTKRCYEFKDGKMSPTREKDAVQHPEPLLKSDWSSANGVDEATSSDVESGESEVDRSEGTCNIISYVFGDTDDEDEEFEGFTDEDTHATAEPDLKGFSKSTDVTNAVTEVLTYSRNGGEWSSEKANSVDEDMFSEDGSSGNENNHWYSDVMEVLKKTDIEDFSFEGFSDEEEISSNESFMANSNNVNEPPDEMKYITQPKHSISS